MLIVDFWPKINIILYPSVVNFTTHIAIFQVRTNWSFSGGFLGILIRHQGWQNRGEGGCMPPLPVFVRSENGVPHYYSPPQIFKPSAIPGHDGAFIRDIIDGPRVIKIYQTLYYSIQGLIPIFVG